MPAEWKAAAAVIAFLLAAWTATAYLGSHAGTAVAVVAVMAAAAYVWWHVDQERTR